MELEAREVGEIKEKEPECTPIRSSSKQNLKMSIRLYQTTALNYKRFSKFKNVIIGLLLAIISKMAGLEVESDWLSVVIWIVGITVTTSYVINSIDRMANYLLGGEYEEGKECI
ncbi:MAG: hypothetical protein V8R90_12325 [Eubacterium sp.]